MGDDFTARAPVTAESVALLMCVVASHFDVEQPSDSDHQYRTLPDDIVAKLCEAAYATREAVEPRSGVDRDVVLGRLASTIATMNALQASPVSAWGRFALVTGHASVPEWDLGTTTSLRDLLENHLQLSTEALMASLFAAYCVANRNGTFHLGSILHALPLQAELEPVLRATIIRHSMTVGVLRQAFMHDHASCPPFGRAFAIFSRHPFIHLGGDYFVSAPHPYARLAMQNGLLFLVREAGASASKPASPDRPGSAHDNQVAHILGDRFERYAFLLGAAAMPKAAAYAEHVYDAKSTSKSPDGIFFLDECDCVLLQAKLRLPSRGLMIGAPDDPWYRDFEDAYARLIEASVRYLFRIHELADGNRLHTLTPNGREVAQRVLSAKKWTLLGVSPMLPPVLHHPEFEARLRKGVRAKLRNNIADWFDLQRSKNRIAAIHVDSIDVLELLAGFADPPHLARRLRRWRKDLRCMVEDLKRQRKQVLPAPFQEYLKNGEPHTIDVPAHLRAAVRQLMTQPMQQYLIGPEGEW